MLRSNVLPTKSGSHRAFLNKLTSAWPWFTLAWSLILSMHYTSVKDPFHQMFVAIGHPKLFYPWLTPTDPYMTFDTRNVLHFCQGFLLLNLVTIGSFVVSLRKYALQLLGPSLTFMPSFSPTSQSTTKRIAEQTHRLLNLSSIDV